MKKCEVCGGVSEDAAPHCPACGEASWVAVTVDAAPVVPAPQDEPEVQPEAPAVGSETLPFASGSPSFRRRNR